MKQQFSQPGHKRFRMWGFRSKCGASYCSPILSKKADSGQGTLGSPRLTEQRRVWNFREAMRIYFSQYCDKSSEKSDLKMYGFCVSA